MKAHICIGATKGCVNNNSYGVICVHCNACGRFDKNTQRECALRMWQKELHEQYCFDNWFEGAEALQRRNIASNVEYFQDKILRLVAEAMMEEVQLERGAIIIRTNPFVIDEQGRIWKGDRKVVTKE